MLERQFIEQLRRTEQQIDAMGSDTPSPPDMKFVALLTQRLRKLTDYQIAYENLIQAIMDIKLDIGRNVSQEVIDLGVEVVAKGAVKGARLLADDLGEPDLFRICLLSTLRKMTFTADF